MARRGRYFLPDQPLHVIQRGNNRQPAFFADEDFRRYRDGLAEAAADHGCAIHAYVLRPPGQIRQRRPAEKFTLTPITPTPRATSIGNMAMSDNGRGADCLDLARNSYLTGGTNGE